MSKTQADDCSRSEQSIDRMPALIGLPSEPTPVTPVTLHGLFEAQARRNPRAVAAICGNERLSYGELDARAAAIASRLAAAGVERGSLVGVYAVRSLDLAAALLGVVKAGAAYVPLDPSYPPERLAFVVADTRIKVLLTQRDLAGALPHFPLETIFCEDIPATEIAANPQTNGRSVGHDDLAYVMYTSGSTGQPKGVMIEHGAVVNTLLDINSRFAVGPADRVLALSSCAFDLSVFDLFGLWAAGGTAVLVQETSMREPAHWAQLIVRHQVTVWNSVPSSMEMLLAQQESRSVEVLASLRLVMLSGDWISVTLPDRIRAANPHAEVISLGGATEASIWSILYPIGACDPAWRSIPYGRAMLNQSIHVLNDRLLPCAAGEVGQIHIGGRGLARGYFDRPDLTAEKFLDDVALPHARERLYATGDLGQVGIDGVVEFLGRNDGQVKIRGYRIELGEVECALARHPAISQAIVLAKERSGHKQLVAFYVSAVAPAATVAELRTFLRDLLPECMVPSRFIQLEQMPLSANGKIDRRALDAMAPHSQQTIVPQTEPANDVERRLQRIWRESFALDQVGTDDDFFDLGGNSLLAAGMFAKIERTFGHAVPYDTLLQCPTIRQFAARLAHPLEVSETVCVQIQAGTCRPPIFCLPGIGGNVLGFRDFAHRLGPSQPVFGLPPLGFGDGRSPHTSIEAMAAHAVCSVRAVQPEGPYHLVGYSLGGVVAFEMAQQLSAAGQTTALLALLDSELWSPGIDLSFRQKVRLHWRKLRARGRFAYLRERGRMLAYRLRHFDFQRADEDLVTGLALTPARRAVAQVHWHAWREYCPCMYDGTITLFTAHKDPTLATTVNGRDPLLGWNRWSTKPVQVHPTSMCHAEMLRAEELQVLYWKLSDSRMPAAIAHRPTILI